jgi:DNA-binding transcriptional LysR family regulator
VVLSVAQPVLSRQIRSLEEELGIELLYRNGRGIVVTEAGELIVERARADPRRGQPDHRMSIPMRSSPSGKLIIGLPPTASAILSVPLIERFREAYPRVKLKVQEGYSGHVLEWLSTGRIDVAVLYDAPKDLDPAHPAADRGGTAADRAGQHARLAARRSRSGARCSVNCRSSCRRIRTDFACWSRHCSARSR